MTPYVENFIGNGFAGHSRVRDRKGGEERAGALRQAQYKQGTGAIAYPVVARPVIRPLKTNRMYHTAGLIAGNPISQKYI